MTTIYPGGLDWATILAMVNVLIFGSIFVVQIVLFRRMKIARLLRVLIMAISIYWAALYAFVAMVPEGFVDPFLFGQVFVRPAFTFTGAVFLACALYRLKSK